MAGLLDEVMTTIQEPDLVQLGGDAGELLALRLSPSRVPRYVVSVYREVSEADGFVITAYVTRQPNRRRKTLWTP